MSKYRPLDAPITRREACTIIDRKRFDAAVRAGELSPLGKWDGENVVPVEGGGRTAPLVFDQQAVRTYAKAIADELAIEAQGYRTESKAVARRKPPLTRRQIAQHLGKRQTGILIRSGALTPDGTLTDTQTAAHTYDPAHVTKVINDLADVKLAESKLLAAASKTRIPA